MTYAEAKVVLGKPVAQVIYGSVSSTGSGWDIDIEGENVSSIVPKRTANSMIDKFGRWAKGSGSFYSVGTMTDKDSETEVPSAHIRLVNVIFPSNTVSSGKKISPREKIERVRDSNFPDILTDDELFSHNIISGAQTSYVPYPASDKVKSSVG